METTTNYGFRKYQSGDLFNPLTVNNPNLDDIDTDMKAVSDRAIGRATELVSQGVHAITVIDTDCKTIKWVATANFTAGETFTVNGIQCNAYLPSGEALGTNAYVSGAQVIASLNADDSAMTIYVPQGSVAVASDSERLGGELPSYYATKDYADGIKSTADNSASLIQKKALVNTYYDSSNKKLYEVNADGTQGGEIKMNSMPTLDFANPIHTFCGSETSYIVPRDGYILGMVHGSDNGISSVSVNGNPLMTWYANGNSGLAHYLPCTAVKTNDTITLSRISVGSSGLVIYPELS